MKNKKSISKDRKVYLKSIKKKKFIILFSQLAILIGFIAIWEILGDLEIIDTFIMSQPSRILDTFMNLTSNDLLKHIGVTTYETVVGFLLGTSIGTIIAIVLWWSEYLSAIFEPYLVVLNSLPKVALGPIIIIWVGAGTSAIVVMAIAISLVGVISGEFLVSKAGIGYLIVYGGQVFKLDLVMTSVLILGILAGVMYGAVLLLEKIISKTRLKV